MCGIFGALGRLSADSLARVSVSMHHRGPDADGQHADDEISLVHRRLKIIDLSDAAAQPMTNEDGTVLVVFNGEIYNHHALRRELGRHTFKSRSDTEVIVHGYEQWGEQVVERLDGMFALAIWDRRRRKLVLARDRAGKKPLFFTRQGGLRFGSTIGSLHASGVEAAVDDRALPFYLAFGFVPPPRTMYLGIEQLPPASRLVWERDAVRVDTYWEPHWQPTATASFENASARVRQLVIAAVERRLESDVPLGAFLSGGIDSTIIVGIMARLLGTKVRSFSIGFSGDARYDETHYARMAARAFGTEHTEFTLEPSSFAVVEELVRHHDGPFGDSSAIPTYAVSKLTRQHVTVALTGDGGDELFCGYSRFLAAEVSELLPLRLRHLGASALRVLPGASHDRHPLGRVRKFLDASALPLPDRLARWNSFFADPQSMLKPDVAQRLASHVDAPLDWQRSVVAQAKCKSTIARVLEHNYRTYLPFDLLVKADRTSMAASLETRSPFLDTALVEYATTLPAAYVRRGKQTKRILKHAFRDLLPTEIQKRGKMGFGVPLGAWFRGDLREYLHDHLGPSARLNELLDARKVSRLLDEHVRGYADHGQKLWALLTLEIWLRSLSTREPRDQSASRGHDVSRPREPMRTSA